MSRPPILTLPPSAEARRLETARGSFAALDALPPAGTAVRGTALLAPGFMGSKEDFIALLEPLAAAGFRTVAVDGRGQHETGGPRDESAYTQQELAADVFAQTDAVRGEGPVHLLGHSFGGLVARAAVLSTTARAHPDAPLPWTSLTIMSSGPGAIDASQQVRTKQLIDVLPVIDMESVWQLMQELEAETVGEPGDTRALAEFLHRRWLGNVPEQLIVTGRQLLSEPDRVDELAAVPLPKLVISGAVDYAWPIRWMDEMAVRLSARRVVIQGAEHSPNAERPAETAAALISFWTSIA
jgi:pimeloyl-ACP methyl ester carboxylesterase